MDVLKKLLAAVEDEEKNGLSSIDSESAEDAWFEEKQPALNEINLLLLVGLRSEVERRLVVLAAMVDKDHAEREIQPEEQARRIEELRKKDTKNVPTGWDWKKIEARLDLHASCHRHAMKLLRLIANSCKHEPFLKPSTELKKTLRIAPQVNCLPLSESERVRGPLAAALGLSETSGYCAIARHFFEVATAYLAEARLRTNLRFPRYSPASSHPDDMAG